MKRQKGPNAFKRFIMKTLRKLKIIRPKTPERHFTKIGERNGKWWNPKDRNRQSPRSDQTEISPKTIVTTNRSDQRMQPRDEYTPGPCRWRSPHDGRMQSHNIGYWYGHQLQNSAESQLGLERPDIPNESTTAIKSVLKLGQAPNVPAIAPGSIRRGPEAEDMSNQMARDDDECRRDFEHDMQLYGKPNLPPGRTPYVVQHASTSPVASTSSSIEVDIPCPYGTDVVNDPGLDKPYTLKVETIEREDGNVTRISSNVKPIIRKRLAEHAGTTSVEDSDAQPPVDNRRVGPNGPSGYNLRRGRNSMQFAHTYNRSDDVFGDDSVSNNSGSPDFQRALRDTQNRNQ